MKLKSWLRRLCFVSLGALALIGGGQTARAEEGELDRSGSFGPRASFYDPKDGDGEWAAGAQLRFFLSEALGFEGSIDYRREEFGETDVDLYPVQASLLAYLIPRRPVSLFLLGGGGWYYTHIEPPSPAEDDSGSQVTVGLNYSF